MENYDKLKAQKVAIEGKMKIYLIMFQNDIFENAYYTDETIVSRRVELLNQLTHGGKYSYITLFKGSE